MPPEKRDVNPRAPYKVHSGTQQNNAIAIGQNSGIYHQNPYSIAIGPFAGEESQSEYSISIGNSAGQFSQQNNSICIGNGSGSYIHGHNSISIGYESGNSEKQNNSISIGSSSALFGQQNNAIAIGRSAGQHFQKKNAISIGYLSGNDVQSTNSIAIGQKAGITNQVENSIILNASVNDLNSSYSGLYIAPVRNDNTISANTVIYNTVTNELTYNTTKTFVIDHPIDEEKYLVHACLEGPEAGVYYRGCDKITNNLFTYINLPDYVSKLATDFTIQITPIYDGKNVKQYNTSKVENGQFAVYGENGEFYWSIYGKRKNILTEIPKHNLLIKGSGPYKWI